MKFRTLNYPFRDFDHHAQIHERLLDRMRTLENQLRNGEIKGIDVFVVFVNEVVIEHLMKEDLEFFRFIRGSTEEVLWKAAGNNEDTES